MVSRGFFHQQAMLTLQLRAPEILQYLFPVRGISISTKIGLQLSTKDLQCGALSATICSNQSQYLSGTRHRKTVQFEAVGRIAVSDLGLEVRGQIDDIDSPKWTFFYTDATSYA